MNGARLLLWGVISALGPLALFGCASGPARQDVSPTQAIRANVAPPEASLLDVGIQVFKTAELDPDVAKERGTHPKILQAEARYIPFHLKKTLQQTGQWGAVRVIPGPSEEVDVSVSGTVVESNGETLRMAVKVVDATGRLWFNNEYVSEITERSYEGPDEKDRDPYQDVYNRVANDMLAYRQELSAKELTTVREVALLRFAGSLVPSAFADYLAKDSDGIFEVKKLPADNDPMFERVKRIRAREHMFVDTVNLYYANLYDDMRQPYGEWRRSSLQELNNKRALERKAWQRRLLGLAAIIGGVVVGTNSNSSGGAAASSVMVIGGYEIFRSGGQFADDAKVHEATLRELGDSFNADVAPILDEVEGRRLKLSGSVDAQYAEWRQALKELFVKETGLPPVAATPRDPALQPDGKP